MNGERTSCECPFFSVLLDCSRGTATNHDPRGEKEESTLIDTHRRRERSKKRAFVGRPVPPLNE